MFKRLRLTSGKTVVVDVKDEDTVSAVKEKIRAKEGIPENEQRLLFVGSNSTSTSSSSAALEQQVILVSETVTAEEVEQHKKEVEERSKDIHEIAKELHEIKEIMADLAIMVQEQGHNVNTIEGNIMQTVQDTEDGVQELEKAKKYQKKSTCVLM